MTAYPRSAGDPIVPWLVELIAHLRSRGIDSEVFTSAYRGGGNDSYNGVPIVRFRYFPARWERLTHEENAADRTGRSPIYALAALCYVVCGALAIRRLIRRRRYDVVHVHWPVPHAVFGWVARHSRNHPALVTTYYGAELRVAARSRILTALLRLGARISAVNVAISRHTAADLARVTERPVEIIPYSAAVALAPRAEGARLERPFTLLFVGRLVARKGVHVLLRALQRPELAAARLEIVGDGPERESLTMQAAREGLSSRVSFAGRVSDEELRAAYARADAFVLPAVEDARGDTEGLGVVLLEAMSYRVPVVASRSGGIEDVVVDGTTGFLVPAGDAEALAAAIARLGSDPELRSRLGEAGRERLESEFAWDRIAERWVRVYERAVTEARS
ncbi:MAG: glycosyltransferase family 4 protein [Gemmatimonadaceae bacterium]|nr:glycosyltransferase family 4 protein [Gemmatimonadaceae bacterium]